MIQQTDTYDVIVIGAGPAGLMAAGRAAGRGSSVLLLEKMNRPGCKLDITGKGRCNLTSAVPLEEHLAHFGPNGLFLRQALFRFCNNDLVAFFEENGVTCKTERGNRVFPVSDRAQDVTDMLVRWVAGQHASLSCSTAVSKLLIHEDAVGGVQTVDGRSISAKAVVIACGGASYPATGSTGDGYRLARQAGHAIVPTRPALVPLETAGEYAARLQGLSLRNIEMQLWINGRKQAAEFGEMLFTHFGLSGPVVLTLSKQAVDARDAGHTVEVVIDLKPALDSEKLRARLQRETVDCGKRKIKTLLQHLLPRTLVPVCADLSGLDQEKPVSRLTTPERERLIDWLKQFRLTVTGYRSLKEAIITAGGVDLKHVNPRTMESKIVSGLYFAGEVLDLDADTGGFNLQAAFSTGYVAGQAAGEGVMDDG